MKQNKWIDTSKSLNGLKAWKATILELSEVVR